jgi:hypothetical protein
MLIFVLVLACCFELIDKGHPVAGVVIAVVFVYCWLTPVGRIGRHK